MAAWVAPIATMIAAMMTAANLGARLTGWGFVVFTVGSIAWVAVGLSSGQTNLIAANGFLTLVNAVGIWRWLGREARYHDDATQITKASERAPVPTVAALSAVIGMAVEGQGGGVLGSVVDVMIDCANGRLAGLLVRYGGVGGVGERVVLIDGDRCMVVTDRITTSLSATDLDVLPDAKDGA